MTSVHPILNFLFTWGPAAAAALCAIGGLYLYFSLRVELNLLSRRAVVRGELESRVSELVAELETLRTRLAAVETRPAAGDWAAQTVNLNRRGQILRLHGKGRTPAEIASDLQISQGEVELFVKVHEWPRTTAL